MLISFNDAIMIPKIFLFAYCCFLLNVSSSMYIFTLQNEGNYVHSWVLQLLKFDAFEAGTCILNDARQMDYSWSKHFITSHSLLASASGDET